MKIVIDYGNNIPDDSLVQTMDQHKSLIIEKLLPIKKELKQVEGIIVLHLDGNYEIKDTPYNTFIQIQDILSAKIW